MTGRAEHGSTPTHRRKRRGPRADALPAPAPLPETVLGHRFADPALLREALTHPTATAQRQKGLGSYERLEFLGDRVLALLVAEWIIELHPEDSAGDLGLRNATLTSRETAVRLASKAGLGALLTVNQGEERTGLSDRPRVLADALEAVLGAIYLDGGLEAARQAVRALWADEVDRASAPPKDPKTALQELAALKHGALPVYLALGRDGPAHAPRFRVAVEVGGLRAEGEGSSKRSAEREAASGLLERLGARADAASPDAKLGAAGRSDVAHGNDAASGSGAGR